ncbi:RWD-domain-containing protein [Terfezia boudieri ATCC MYA-4762]|uniref:RWD-domain-containing protein n=1 Tax=Terfezia boudieri ATCC MYA-4762 TaxID=1051890 RepID=A0A3N4LZS8_9PEZI|nr:RWD-domain-containing protein [Terfezia boudieri ATCC MYA-4762]
MPNEEQEQEIEVLQSIYPDELTIIDDESIRIRIPLETPPGFELPGANGDTDEGDDADEPTPPTLLLTVKYPSTYPDAAPDLDLSLDPSCPRGVFDFPSDRDSILTDLPSTIGENLGMAMVFTLVTTIKDAAEQLIQARVDAIEKAREDVIRQEEEKEMAKFKGTPVTRETFMAWREKFRAEMEELKRKREKDREDEDKAKRGNAAQAVAAAEAMKKRMTGKQLYQSGTVGKDDDIEVDGEEVDLAKLKLEEGEAK